MKSAHARRGRTTCLALACALLACAVACKKPDPPIMTVDAVKAVDWAVTGVALDITFKLRNPNPKALRIQRFDYDLFLNGQLVGHGYQSAGVDLAGFAEQKVSSRLDVSFLKAPFAIKEIFTQKNALAKAKGNFYVKLGWTTRAVPFDRDMDFTLRQGPDAEPSAAPPARTAPPASQPARPGRSRPSGSRCSSRSRSHRRRSWPRRPSTRPPSSAGWPRPKPNTPAAGRSPSSSSWRTGRAEDVVRC